MCSHNTLIYYLNYYVYQKYLRYNACYVLYRCDVVLIHIAASRARTRVVHAADVLLHTVYCDNIIIITLFARTYVSAHIYTYFPIRTEV